MPTPAPISGLYGIADAGFRPDLPFPAKVKAFVEGGACAVQVRCKSSTGELVSLARTAMELCRGRALCVVNDRVDVALLVGADGVHLGEDDLGVAEVRRISKGRILVGATVRTLEEARRAEGAGADYVGFGPMFPTATKDVGVPLRSLSSLEETAKGIRIPIVAISGITLERAPALFARGAAAVAVVSDVLGNADPVARARRYAELPTALQTP